MSHDEKYADKIAKLLRKAESTSPEEAEALFAKAQELMARYAITEQMLAYKRNESRTDEEITRDTIFIHSSYSRALFQVASSIAKANGCRVLIRKGKDLMHTDCIVIGYTSDIERTKMLNQSLQIQALHACNIWWREHPYRQDLSAREKFKERRQFIFSFAHGLQNKLDAATKAGQAAAADELRGKGHAGVAEGMELVITSRKDAVEAYMDQSYDRLRKSRGNFAGGSSNASRSGHAAGLNSNIGQPTVGSEKGALNR